MAEINWDEIREAFGWGKRLAQGKYTATVKSIEVSDTPTKNGAYAINIHLEDHEEGYFPYFATHWISFKNDNWRVKHILDIITSCDVLMPKAQQVIQECENAGTNEQIVAAYAKKFKALGGKHPKVAVVVDTTAYKYRDKETGKEELREDGLRTEFNTDAFMPPQTLEGLRKRYPHVPVQGESDQTTLDDLGGETDMSLDTPF